MKASDDREVLVLDSEGEAGSLGCLSMAAGARSGDGPPSLSREVTPSRNPSHLRRRDVKGREKKVQKQSRKRGEA